MNIIVLTSTGSVSGGARQALVLAAGLQKLGYTVHFVCPPKGETREQALEMGLSQVDLPEKLFEVNKTLRALMPAGVPTIVHGFHNRGVKLVAYLGTWWRLLGLPVACAAHRGVTSRPGNPLPYLLPGIRAYLVNSQACADMLPLFWRRRRCHVVSNSIPEERLIPTRSKAEMRLELNLAEGDKVIGDVCNDNPQKGAGQALKAFALAKPGLPAAKLVIVGVTADIWLPLCEELGIVDEVRLVPRTDHVADYIQLMDLLVFPSWFIESQPNVIMEAMSMGVPVIAGDAGGVRELLPPEFLFDPKDEHAVSVKLTELMQSPEALKRLGEANAAQKDRFSTERRLREVVKYYRAALQEILPEGTTLPPSPFS